MVRSEWVDLGTETVTRNTEGFESKTWAWASVPAERRSVGRTEYYAAVGAGYNPQRVYRVRSCAYDDQPRVKDAAGLIYKVIRTYDDGDYTELTCERMS